MENIFLFILFTIQASCTNSIAAFLIKDTKEFWRRATSSVKQKEHPLEHVPLIIKLNTSEGYF